MDSFWQKVDNKQIPAEELEILKGNFETIKSAVADTQSKLHQAMLDEVAPQLKSLLIMQKQQLLQLIWL